MRKARVVHGRGHAGGRARLALDHHEVLGTQDADHELGEHALEVQVLRQHVDALGQLAQAHVGNVSGDRGLGAGVAHCLQLVDETALRADGLAADDLPDGVLPAVPALHGMLPTMATPGGNRPFAYTRQIIQSCQRRARSRRSE